MNIQRIEGLIAAPFTPLNQDETLNVSIIPSYYQMLKRNGVNGAFICGSTGEGVSITLDEKKLISKAWAEAIKGDNEFKVTLFFKSCRALVVLNSLFA